jgi:hypothetical protein
MTIVGREMRRQLNNGTDELYRGITKIDVKENRQIEQSVCTLLVKGN